MSRHLFTLLLGLCMALCIVFPVQAYHIPTAAEGLLDQQGCYIGAYLGGNSYTDGPDDGHETWIKDPAAFNTEAGKTHRLFSRYVSLGNSLNNYENRDGKTTAEWAKDMITTYDAVPVIFLVPWDTGLDLTYKYDDGQTWRQRIDSFAAQLKPLTAKGDTIIIVFGHEMESQAMAHDAPANFTAMFQYASDSFHAAGCQVAWCSNMNDNPFEADNKMQWWPGSENPVENNIARPGKPGKMYVDWVAQTRYHWWWGKDTFTGLKGEYQAHPEKAWYNYFGTTLGIPLMFAETAGQKPAPYDKTPGSSWDPDPLNKATQEFSAEWIPSLYDAQKLKNNYPRLKAIIWFDTVKNNDNGQPQENYLIPPGVYDAGSKSVIHLAGPDYKSHIADPYFLGGTGFGEPEEPGETGSLYVYTTPSGASIYIDGVVRGTSNQLVSNVSTGLRNLTLVKPGYQTRILSVDVPEDDVKVLSPITLQPGGPSAGKGSIYVYSSPSGATIYIDGTTSGTTNRLVTNVTAGTRNLTLTKMGYQSKTLSVTVKAGDVRVLAPISLAPV